jgi:nuclear autoantigenic sperm protein
VSGKNDQEDDGDSDTEELAEGDEDESDLDLAWKMLDVARAIVEKQSVNTMEQVDILSTLADVALEKGIFTLLCLF